MKKLLIILMILSAMFADSGLPEAHVCEWVECPINHLGWEIPTNPVTDAECYVVTHYNHPAWSYEECENYVFSLPTK